MRLREASLPLLLVGIAAAGAVAQPPATAVQLPTFSSFSGSTTVSVPDRGSVYFGGIKRAATGRNEFGVPMLPLRPFRNSASGSERSVSSLHVTAWIHDFDEMDEALLSRPTSFSRFASQRQRQSGVAALGKTLQPRKAAYGQSWVPSFASRSFASSSGAGAKMNLAEAQARRIRQQDVRSEEAAGLFQRGLDAETAGKTNVAKIFYQMAARRIPVSVEGGQLKARIAARLQAIGLAQTVTEIAQSHP